MLHKYFAEQYFGRQKEDPVVIKYIIIIIS